MDRDTPRTDEEIKRISSQFDGEEDDIQYAMDQLGIHSRKLERELAAMQKQRDEADEECREATASWNREANETLDLYRELAAMQKQRDEAHGQTLYLLYDGTSEDGRGSGKYIGRTTDKNVARNHHAKCRKNPYSIGFVEIVTDTEKKQVSYCGSELQPENEGGGA